MKFLAIDTSGRQLNTVCCNEQTQVVLAKEDCAMRHSVLLMDEIDAALKKARLTADECDFFACVVGPGSFTGIRIGIATVKGLCLAGDKKALPLTAFDCLAYADTSERTLCLVDAGHGNYYACGYTEKEVSVVPSFVTRAQVDELIAQGYAPVAQSSLFEGVRAVDTARGLLLAAQEGAHRCVGAHALEAMYLRKSSAEEGR